MDFNLTSQEEAFKKAFYLWLEKNLPLNFEHPDYQTPDSWEERVSAYRDFQKRLYEAGYAGILYPKEYGGRGGTFFENLIVTEALSPWMAKVWDVATITHSTASNTLSACGSEEQKRYFLPKIFKGEHIWCQAFSEPNAGSDVGNLSTRAVRKEDDYVINGQKTWITMGHVADYCLLLLKTDPNAPKYRGMSYLIVDMKLPGIKAKPIVQITGDAEFNEVFFDDVRVPSTALIGEEGKGWQVAFVNLMYERTMGDISFVSAYSKEFEALLGLAGRVNRKGRPVLQDPVIRQRLAQCYIDLMVVRHCGYRSAWKIAEGKVPGPEGSIGKLMWSELYQRMTDLATEITGPYHQLMKGSPEAVDQGKWGYDYLFSKAGTIAGGTSEIQRNTIAEGVLGLPKEKRKQAKML